MMDASIALNNEKDMDYPLLRLNMIEQQIRPWDVLDPRILNVFRSLWRHDFVPLEYRRLAYADFEIPVNHGEHMMRPTVEGRMLQALSPKPQEQALEIGTGSGYVTACLAHLVKQVDSVEVYEDFINQARERLSALVIEQRVHLQVADVSAANWASPQIEYDIIALTGAVPRESMLEPFKQLLKPGGRLFAIIGEPPVMGALLIHRMDRHDFCRTLLFETRLAYLHGFIRPRIFKF